MKHIMPINEFFDFLKKSEEDNINSWMGWKP